MKPSCSPIAALTACVFLSACSDVDTTTLTMIEDGPPPEELLDLPSSGGMHDELPSKPLRVLGPPRP